jgi:hypothetical protein
MSRMRYIELKLSRAKEHLEALRTELQAYYDSQPCTISKFQRQDVGRRGLLVEIAAPSDRVYVIAGDFAHTLRSVLDHIVYALIVEATKELPDSTQVQWPVQIRRDQSALDKQTKGAPSAAAAIIESLQPYYEGAGESYKKSALWQLHKLDIIDKHRRIAVNQLSLESMFSTRTPESDVKIEKHDHGFEITFPIDSPVVELHLNPKPEVIFGDADEGLFVGTSRLEEIGEFVSSSVLPKFSGFLRPHGQTH